MADLGSLDFLKSGTRHLLRRFSGDAPRGSSQRSSSCPSGPTGRRAKAAQFVQESVFAEHLAHLRKDMEHKTALLNDSKFEVTEEWLFEFAAQHGEYMEKATSRAGSTHDFRSTTDLFQHVLQHPKLLKLVGGRPSAVHQKLSASPGPWSPSLSPGSTGTPGSAERLAEDSVDHSDGRCPSESSPLTNAFGADVSADIDDKTQATQKLAENLKLFERSASQFERRIKPVGLSPVPPATDVKKSASLFEQAVQMPPVSDVKKKASFFEHAAKSAAPTPMQHTGDMGRGKPVRSSSCTGFGKAQPRATWAAPSVQPASGESELMRKLRQRAESPAGVGLSPRARRASRVEDSSNNADDAHGQQSGSNIAARRKLLENKLAGCGFQKAAAGGA